MQWAVQCGLRSGLPDTHVCAGKPACLLGSFCSNCTGPSQPVSCLCTMLASNQASAMPADPTLQASTQTTNAPRADRCGRPTQTATITLSSILCRSPPCLCLQLRKTIAAVALASPGLSLPEIMGAGLFVGVLLRLVLTMLSLLIVLADCAC